MFSTAIDAQDDKLSLVLKQGLDPTSGASLNLDLKSRSNDEGQARR